MNYRDEEIFSQTDDLNANRNELSNSNPTDEITYLSDSSELAIFRQAETGLQEEPRLFSLNAFRSPDPNIVTCPPARKIQTMVQVGKPSRLDHFRVNPDPNCFFDATCLDLQSGLYLVSNSILSQVPDTVKISTKRIFLTVTQKMEVSLWPITYPSGGLTGGWVSPWIISALRAAGIAKRKWIRLLPNSDSNRYDVVEATWDLEPVWPQQSFKEILELAFKDRIIESTNHPAILYLNSECYMK